MASTIRIKRSGSTVSPTTLASGELAYSWAAGAGGKLYLGTGSEIIAGQAPNIDNKAVKFYKDPMNLGGNSYYKENTVHYNETHIQHELGYTLDTIVKQNDWPLPDMIKLDVQGAEMDILKGAKTV